MKQKNELERREYEIDHMKYSKEERNQSAKGNGKKNYNKRRKDENREIRE